MEHFCFSWSGTKGLLLLSLFETGLTTYVCYVSIEVGVNCEMLVCESFYWTNFTVSGLISCILQNQNATNLTKNLSIFVHAKFLIIL